MSDIFQLSKSIIEMIDYEYDNQSMKQQHQDTVDNVRSLRQQFDAKTLQYYTYLRTLIQARDISYWIGNPSVSITSGNINLAPLSIPNKTYQNYQEYVSALRLQNTREVESSSPPTPKKPEQPTQPQNLRSSCLVLCGIPNSKSPIQIIQNSHLGEYRSAIVEMRVVKTVHLKYYAMLLLFKNRRVSTIFFNDLFGVQYNQVEIQRIILRQMQEITISVNQLSKEGTKYNSQINQMTLFRKVSGQNLQKLLQPQLLFMNGEQKQASSSPVKQEQQSQRKNCTICLQQVTTKVISLLCGHYFHCQCLQRWQYNTCPLCRYHQQPPVISFCQKCNQCEGLWVCLICGARLCCGTTNDILGQDSHIYEHFIKTKHSLSMELQTKFIFDAKVPAFLHQMFYRDLIQKGATQEHNSNRLQKEDMKKNKLSDKISTYENQVAQQMLKQRLYFQQSIARNRKQHRQLLARKLQKIKELQQGMQEIDKQSNFVGQKIQQQTLQLQGLQKQEKVLGNLSKMYVDKIEKLKTVNEKAVKMQKNRVRQIQALIQQKRQQLRNFKTNLALQQKIKQKLKGQKIEGQIFLMHDKPKKKKR